ncbi:MAG: pyroglutamyl-peptidase I [Theionarchaea archaeon]|nr:MAG: pyrrolidone-carboxylate peptidase [Theionarchaea archaeon DG-70-1]MBU7029264.1 pyroglutamyl-peptidase I [Theionarchaea archaeon]
MKVLVTGFEPFKKEKVNPSWEVCKALSQEEDVQVVTRQLPVVFDEAKKKAVEYVDQVNPDVVLHLGEAGGRTHISVERIAINCDDASSKDNKGQKRDNRKIEPDGEDGLFTTIPVKKIVKALKEASIPAVVSNSAGTYLCNHVLYATLHHVKQNNLPTKVGFIHLPYLPQQTVDKPGKASMSLDVMVEAVNITIKECKA